MVKKKKVKIVPKLRFPGFKGEWVVSKLGDIAEKIQDGTHFSPKQYESGNFKYITSRNIRNGYMDLCDVPYLSDEAHREIYKRCDVRYNDVLLTKDGASTGNVCLNELEEEFSLLSSVAFIRANKNKSINEYIYQYICSPNGQREIRSTIAGQAITRITLTKLRNYKFHFPTLPEQEKIASFLSAMDKKIQKLTARKELLKGYKKGVMQRIFSQEMRFTDDNGKDYPDWEEKKLGDVLNTIPTKPYQIKSSEILTNGILPVIDQGKKLIAGYSNDNNKVFKNKGIVIYGDHTTILKYIDFDFIIGADGTKLLTTEDEDLKYLYYNLMYNNIEPEGYKRHFSILKKIYLQIPCIDEQKKISSFLTSFDKKIESVQSQLIQIKTFKKGLLQQMFV